MNDGIFRRNLGEDPFFCFQIDAPGAMGAGVRKLDVVFTVLAVDQQQEVDGSRYAEPFIVIQGHCMKRKPKTFEKPTVVLVQ